MRKAAVPALVIAIFLAFGIILAAILITWGMDQLMRAVNGKCWADAGQAISDMRSDFSSMGIGDSKVRKIPMGDCVGGIVIFRRGTSPGNGALNPIIEDSKCPTYSGYKSYAVMLPWKTVKAELQKDKSLWQSISEKFKPSYYASQYKSLAQSIRLLKPYCIGIEYEFDDEYFLPASFKDISDPNKKDTFNEKDISYCCTLFKKPLNNQQGFQYSISCSGPYALDYQCLPGAGGTFGGGGSSSGGY